MFVGWDWSRRAQTSDQSAADRKHYPKTEVVPPATTQRDGANGGVLCE